MSRSKNKKKNIEFIDGLGSLSNYSEDDGIINTSGLVLAEGCWTDSKGRTHDFPKERILLIQHNTNASFNSGKDIPILQDHKKEASSYSGEVEKEFIVRPITTEDLPENKRSRLNQLVGKLGIFAEGVKITAQQAVQKYKDGLKTISPGIDIVNDVIREISMTPTPAIQGMALYMQGNTRPLTWDEAEESNVELEKLEDEFESLSEKFFDLIENIYSASEEELSERDPLELISINLEDYVSRLSELFGLNEMEDEDQYLEDPEQPINQQKQMKDLSQYSMAYHAENNAEFRKGFGLGKLVSKIGGRGAGRAYRDARKAVSQKVGNLGSNIESKVRVYGRNVANRYTERIPATEAMVGKGQVARRFKDGGRGLLARDAAIGAGGLALAGGGAVAANRYLNPNSKRNKRKRQEQSPLGQLQRRLGL